MNVPYAYLLRWVRGLRAFVVDRMVAGAWRPAAIFGRVRAWGSGPSARRLGRGAGVLALLGLGAVAVAGVYYEYRTHRFARWMGDALVRTNPNRRAAGEVWQDLRSRAEARRALDAGPEPPLPPGGLPEAVERNRFEMRRIPEDGLPGYVAVWRTPVSARESERRDAPEVVASLRAYRRGLALLEAAEFSDDAFRERARREIEALYRQVGDIELSAPDTVAQADSARVMSPDSLRAAVVSELARDVASRLKRDAHRELVADYRAGRVEQVLVRRGPDGYEAEVTYEAGGTPGPVFSIPSAHLAQVFDSTGVRP